MHNNSCRRFGLHISGLIILVFAADTLYAQSKSITADMNNVRLEFRMDDGVPTYSVFFKEKPVIEQSKLGLEMQNSKAFEGNMELLSTSKTTHDDTWRPVWGEVSSIRNHYTELTVHLKEKGEKGKLLDIVFRVFEDGVGFRYEFPNQPGLKYFIVMGELTQFKLTGDHKAFWIPGDYDVNEYQYTTSKLSEVDAWKTPKSSTKPDQWAVQTPLMLKTADGLYINIHEAALVNYPAMQLHVDRDNFTLSSRLVPDALGNKAYLRAPCHTPWRTIVVSDKATDILASKMILNLNEPSAIKDSSWIKPMKFVGVWWEMHVDKGTWNYTNNPDTLSPQGQLIPNGKHSANTANVKRYIDFAAKHGIEGVLVEGWNVGWEEWWGNWKEEQFDFVMPYPDFNIKEVTRYAAAKGVKMIMHHETSGSVTNYERRMDTAFRLMNNFGYTAVKTGYVGKIIPRGEYHDGQWMANHYVRVAQKAAQYKVMIDVHEPVRPTGLHRTYPNWMACEAARGNEYNAGWGEHSPPEHETILPFTRLMGGPMDYTPGIFKLTKYTFPPSGKQVPSTLAKQLALYITLYSPVQMAADLPENYEAKLDAFQFIKDVGVDWDDTKFIEAEPGDYVTIARKEKGTGNWFIGAITDENKRSTTVPLGFLDKGKKYVATIYADADNADYKTNPEAYKIEKFIVDSATALRLKLAAGGGAAISIFPAAAKDLKSIQVYK